MSRMATRGDWRITPFPSLRAAITLDGTYSREEFARIKQGFVPVEMEDKWFAYYEEPWLFIHRGWTGFGIYKVRFEETEGGGRIADVLVNRDPEQYRSTDGTADAKVLAWLLDAYAGRTRGLEVPSESDRSAE